MPTPRAKNLFPCLFFSPTSQLMSSSSLYAPFKEPSLPVVDDVGDKEGGNAAQAADETCPRTVSETWYGLISSLLIKRSAERLIGR